jgi:hypothetical protein
MAVSTATLNDGLESYGVATTIHVRIELTSDITLAELRAKLIEERGETSLTSPRPLSRCSIVLTELRERLAVPASSFCVTETSIVSPSSGPAWRCPPSLKSAAAQRRSLSGSGDRRQW